jgi:LysM repeat protein
VKIHIVKKGDTLYNLAGKYKVELDAIIALNPQIEDTNRIDVGMKVKIPTGPQPVEPPLSAYAHKHIVKQGDSLWKLGKAWEVPLQAMIKANPQLKNPNVLMTGEVVYIPKMESEQTYTPQENEPSAYPYPPNAPMALSADYPPMPQQETHTGDITTPAAPISAPTPAPAPAAAVSPVSDYSGELNAGYTDWINQTAPQPTMETNMNAELSKSVGPKPDAEEPIWNLSNTAPQEQAAAMPPASPDLTVPYHQAQHPFEQFHIKASEVFAYSLPMEYPSETVSSHLPQMPPAYEGHQPLPAYLGHQAQPGYSDGGCGCGGPYMNPSDIQPWHAYPAYSPMSLPYAPYPMHHPISPMYPYPVMSPPCYPFSGEFQTDPAFGVAHPPMGMPHSASFETPGRPPEAQAHIHEWTGKEEIETDQQRDSSAEKNINKTAGKTSGSAKKAKSSSGNDDISTHVRKQQLRVERAEPRANLPWINV